MLKKRLVGVIAVRNGQAVQSFGYRRHLPLGRADILAANLDRWGCDEILVLGIDRSRLGLGPDIELLKQLAAMRLSTPLIYGGGIRTVEQAAMVIHHGADRVCVDAALHHDAQPIRDMATLLGAQALIGAVPVSLQHGEVQWLDHRSGLSEAVSGKRISLFDEGVISEALLIDWMHEGMPSAFDPELVTHFPVADVPLIAFGGISEPSQAAALWSLPRISAVAVGNALNYTELAAQRFKESGPASMVRSPTYATSHGSQGLNDAI
ncbi:MAG: HisA/HisF-related TIM barrel protein [Pseudomonadota bacterium]